MALYSYIDACYNRLLAGSASSPLPIVPDFPRQVVEAISNRLGLLFIAEKVAGGNLCLANAEEVRPEYRTTFSPGDLLDYYYGLLHLPRYRLHYQEFSKKGFSSLPYPKDVELFWLLAQLGRRLRQLHLLERPEKEHHLHPFPISGSNRVLVQRFVV